MKVSFLIRTLNEANDLQKTLDLINNQNGDHEIEVLIVDSGSTDTTLDIAKKNNCQILLMKQEEWSWGRSLNYGFENASYEYVVIISAHCFLSSNEFLNNLEVLTETNHDVVAFYGQQLPIKNYDPFEEYELNEWYPDITIKMYQQSDLVGISNACSVVKKSIWQTCQYDEKVDSLEDGIWATNIIKNGLILMYSSHIGVFHSHRFNPEYIYRKWYWRTYESIKFAKKYLKLSHIKQTIKFFLFKPYMFIKNFIEIYKIYQFLKLKYDFIKLSDVYFFVRIKNSAIVRAYYDSKSMKISTSSYWKLMIPDSINELTQLSHIKPSSFLV